MLVVFKGIQLRLQVSTCSCRASGVCGKEWQAIEYVQEAHALHKCVVQKVLLSKSSVRLVQSLAHMGTFVSLLHDRISHLLLAPSDPLER